MEVHSDKKEQVRCKKTMQVLFVLVLAFIPCTACALCSRLKDVASRIWAKEVSLKRIVHSALFSMSDKRRVTTQI